VLVVDDDPDMRALIASALGQCGYRVLATASGRHAVRLLEETPVDLLITDLFMPEFDGLETIRAIRSRPDRLPILAISGGSRYVALDFLPIAELLGADAVLPKPFALKALEQQVRALLPDSRAPADEPVANDN
jgi:CheY-like chemotaxis protein